MKKILFKVLGTILAVVVFFISQFYIRRHFGIDPRIWFFVVFGISFVVFLGILLLFYSEIKSLDKYFTTHSIFELISEISEKQKTITNKIKPIAEKVVNSFVYGLISFICLMTSFTGIMYKLFFFDDFASRTTLYIIFLIMIAMTALTSLIKGFFSEREKRTKELYYGGLWVFIFLMNYLQYVSI